MYLKKITLILAMWSVMLLNVYSGLKPYTLGGTRVKEITIQLDNIKSKADLVGILNKENSRKAIIVCNINIKEPLTFERAYDIVCYLSENTFELRKVTLENNCQSILQIESKNLLVKLYSLFFKCYKRFPYKPIELVKCNLISKKMLDSFSDISNEDLILQAKSIVKKSVNDKEAYKSLPKE